MTPSQPVHSRGGTLSLWLQPTLGPGPRGRRPPWRWRRRRHGLGDPGPLDSRRWWRRQTGGWVR